MKALLFNLVISFSALTLYAQPVKPDLQNLNNWQAVNRQAEKVNDSGKSGVRLSATEGDGLLILKDSKFLNGTIEFDVKGKNVLQQSFVGIAFHIQDDKTYDGIYFRPFNFMNADTARRWRAVQYISHPTYTWDKLRADSPGKYESKVNPVPNPDGWFHARVVVNGKSVQVFVNDSTKPSLVVERIANLGSGRFGFWVGNGSDGNFANLVVTPAKD